MNTDNAQNDHYDDWHNHIIEEDWAAYEEHLAELPIYEPEDPLEVFAFLDQAAEEAETPN